MDFSEITKEFLEKSLKRPVKNFSVAQGSKKGDNYLGIMVAVEVTTVAKNGQDETQHIILKCYPTHPTRQFFNNKENVFYNELKAYQDWIPVLNDLKNRFLPNQAPLGFAPFIGGEAVNYRAIDESKWKKIYGPLENHLIMVDVRKSFGYQMENRNQGLSEAHCFLVINELARIHALSWAYKKQHNIKAITEHFPSLHLPQTKENTKMFENYVRNNVQLVIDCVQGKVSSEAVEGWKRLLSNVDAVMAAYYRLDGLPQLDKTRRVPMSEQYKDLKNSCDTDSEWSVVCHGDCWMNNILFKYGEKGAPENVILVDLQQIRELSPTIDLANLIFAGCGLSSARRKAAFDDFLKSYVKTFLNVCESVGCEPLPGFCFKSLKYRLLRTAPYGAGLAAILAPIMFIKSNQAKDLDKDETEKADDIGEMLKTVTDSVFEEGSSEFMTKMVELTQEFYEYGVL